MGGPDESLVLPSIRHPVARGFPRTLRRLVKLRGVDVVHLHFGYSLPVALALDPRGCPVPVVYHWHNPPRALQDAQAAGGIRREGSRLLARLGGRVIRRHVAISEEIQTLLTGHGWASPERVVLIPNALARLPEPQERRPDRETLTVVSVANFRPQKDHRTLVQAFARLTQETPARLVLVGDGPTRPGIVAEVSRFGLEDQVTFTGFVDDPAPYLADADLFVLATHFEGHPLGVMEAMSHALPVVATDVESLRNTLVSGKEGLLVPPEDVAALAGAMVRLAADAALGQRLGSAARDRVRHGASPQAWW